MERRRHSTGTEWEGRVGYSRALRAGPHVYVAGTLGVGPDGRPPPGVYDQCLLAVERIRGALEALGATLDDVVRTRMYVVDVERHQHDVGRAHMEAFGRAMPASTMVGIAALVAPEYLVEIEVEALVDG